MSDALALPALDPVPAARALVLGRPTPTNEQLVAAFRASGFESAIHAPACTPRVGRGDVVLARLDVLPTLDGIEDGLRTLSRARRAGATVLNGPGALLNAHDKLATAVVLAHAGVRHPRTAHVSEPRAPQSFGPPYVVKPRFGSWGRDVVLCETTPELLRCLASLRHRRWFRKQGALVQELVPPTGLDLRIVVAGGRVVGAVERHAPSGEWRTNVAVGAQRRAVDPPPEARLTALGAVAAIGSDLAGVDLVTAPDGAYVVLEVNGAVEFTAEYAHRGVDPFFAAARALGFNRALAGILGGEAEHGG